MKSKSLLPVFGVLLVSGAFFLVCNPGLPLKDTDSSGTGSTAITADDTPKSDVPSASDSKRDRPPRDGESKAAEITRNLAQLGALDEDELAEQVCKRAAAWPKGSLSATVNALFADGKVSPAAVALRLALLRRWATLSPADAALWAAALPPGAARHTAVESVALAWSAADAQAAWDWADGLDHDDAREAALLSLAYELARENPALAFERSAELAEGQDSFHLIEHAVANWALADAQAALAHVLEIDDFTLRNAALGHLATSWADSDPRSAATLAVDAMDAGPEQERTVASIVQRWAQREPEGVSAWVELFPEGPVKRNALEHIVAQSPKPESLLRIKRPPNTKSHSSGLSTPPRAIRKEIGENPKSVSGSDG